MDIEEQPPYTNPGGSTPARVPFPWPDACPHCRHTLTKRMIRKAQCACCKHDLTPYIAADPYHGMQPATARWAAPDACPGAIRYGGKWVTWRDTTLTEEAYHHMLAKQAEDRTRREAAEQAVLRQMPRRVLLPKAMRELPEPYQVALAEAFCRLPLGMWRAARVWPWHRRQCKPLPFEKQPRPRISYLSATDMDVAVYQSDTSGAERYERRKGREAVALRDTAKMDYSAGEGDYLGQSEAADGRPFALPRDGSPLAIGTPQVAEVVSADERDEWEQEAAAVCPTCHRDSALCACAADAGAIAKKQAADEKRTFAQERRQDAEAGELAQHRAAMSKARLTAYLAAEKEREAQAKTAVKRRKPRTPKHPEPAPDHPVDEVMDPAFELSWAQTYRRLKPDDWVAHLDADVPLYPLTWAVMKDDFEEAAHAGYAGHLLLWLTTGEVQAVVGGVTQQAVSKWKRSHHIKAEWTATREMRFPLQAVLEWVIERAKLEVWRLPWHQWTREQDAQTVVQPFLDALVREGWQERSPEEVDRILADFAEGERVGWGA